MISARRHKRAFTLLEVTIVSIVIGILATIAIKNYMMVVDRQRAAEAINVLSQAYVGYQRLAAEGESMSGLTWARLGITGLNATNSFPGGYFTYRLQSGPDRAEATRIGSPGNTKTIAIDFTTGIIQKSAFYEAAA